ncbi:putative P-loop containing nucleoside triphosphate hydrolase, leucine-rich repeat domain, L [Medicago truncatula]|uniref:LRR and NB-ARC domain disease resistance protein n=1 Tax=Medicago truncatula TaxID=3880 RepID=G7J1K9_MEDTR|nr:putative disease resistance protein At3g14460 [Medicago truncatula]XP_039687662.1 putative disease resistance protein At3g14460 [Medicago truncatula]XP_039687663.1 putative disease resistance protein At3g14460 [Medicago truncatula]XP_039687664.1 putative disease resistance protein At3g14460 [Medicago truncatula]XP_039687665.1 putative disease resistance protein At3g14460 [Medicago truncatula]XP_039687666.1 putative disease resistance protein At3g14460 [Medicago truncatula]XP_039687667.1 pu
MAELVGGAVLSSFFPVILKRIGSRDFKDLFNKKLVEKLEVTLNSIDQLLNDAETKKYQNQNVKKWFDNLKHEVYEVDQLLDEIDTNVKLKSKDMLGSKVKYLLSAITNPFESRIKELLGKLKYLAEQKGDLGLTQRSCTSYEGAVSPQSSKRSPTASLVDESSIRGREGEKEEIINYLLSYKDNGNQVSTISIVGLGGMGKTTLAQLVYNDCRIQEKFEIKAWVHVSKYFDVIGLTKIIIGKFDSAANSEDLELLQRQLQKILTAKNYLLVVDDVWKLNEESWETLLLPFNQGSSTSKIIVTTRDKNVASIVKSTKLFDLKQLEKSDSWSLFSTLAFHGKNASEYPKLESIGKKIVDKCGGLPLAVKTLGNLLRKKFSKHEWEKILEADMWRLADGDGDSNINSALRLSYHNLPSSLKRCFAYCSVFPRGFEFDRDELIKLWMAEGLLKYCGRDKSEEELGNEFMDYLESISFFEQLNYDGRTRFLMHDLVNDLAKSESQEFCLQIESDNLQDITERTRHIRCNLDFKDGEQILKHIYKFKGLRSLLVVRPKYGQERFMISNNVQRDLFSKLKYLRMLSFCYCELKELAGEIRNLKLLRYLDMRGTQIKRLPDSICNLYNLETLILEKCYELTELPSNFYKLVSLRHLNLEGCNIKKMPKKIGRLNHLQTLSHFVVGEQSGSDITELGNLNHLQGKLCISGLEHVISLEDAAAAKLKDKEHVEELNMEWSYKFNTNGRESDVFEALQPNSNLEKLNIKHYKGNSFPSWLRACHLSNLVSLQLDGCGLCPRLEQLPSLRKLSVCDCDEIKIIDQEFYDNDSTIVPFRSLEVLKFEKMNNWEKWFCLEGFPLLKKISIRKCPKLKKAVLPKHLTSLQKLEISYCNKLEELLCLGEFPLLKEIYIFDCPKLKRALPQHLPSLQKLHVFDCNELEKWFCLEGIPLLKEISIRNCPKLKRALLPQHLPSLQKLKICDCNKLEELLCLGEFPLLKEISISDCPELKRALPQHLPSLQNLEIWDCNKLEELLCLGEFPLLKEISIRNCPELKRALPQHLPSLQNLEIWDCNKLEELLCLGEFPLLKEISIRNCPELKRALPQHLPSLQKLQIWDCNKMEASIPKSDNMIELDIQRCDRILVNELPTSLKRLLLCDNQYTEFSVDQNLINFPFLEELELAGSVKCPSLDLSCYNSLQRLSIEGWGSSSLPLELHLFTSLRSLYLDDCPELESFPMGGLPSNLRDLRIHNCPKLIGSREEWGLFQLNSLKWFSVSDEFENVESFPEENLLPPTLKDLYLINCSKLRKMNKKGFLHLKSLNKLYIRNCPSLESLPEKEDLPNSLSSFYFGHSQLWNNKGEV